MAPQLDPIIEEAGLGPGWAPLDGPPIIPGQIVAAPPASDSIPTNPKYIQGTIAPNFQHDASFVDTAESSHHVPKFDLMPLGVQNSIESTQVQGTTVKIIESRGAGVLLETDGVTNPKQSELNLISGSNIVLTPDTNGGVTITGTAGGDGLTHGNTIWEIDPAFMLLREDFNNPSVFPGPPTSSNTFGSGLNWHIVTGGTYVNTASGAFPLNGVLASSNTASSNSGFFVELANGASNLGSDFPLLDYPGWKMIWVFQILRNNSSSPAAFSWTQVSNYVGLASYGAATVLTGSSPRPPYFLGLRYDTDTTAPSIGDTQFVFEYVANFTTTPLTRINTQGTTFSTGITVTEGRIYRLEISCASSGSISLFLTDGITTAQTTLSISKLSFSDKQPTFSNSNGQFGANWSTGTNLPIDLGTVVTISGGSISAGNGTFTHQIPRGVTGELRLLSSATPAGVDTGATTSFYPALRPFFSFGNDSSASPVVNSKGVLVDFMSLVWNKGLITGGATPNPTLARYW